MLRVEKYRFLQKILRFLLICVLFYFILFSQVAGNQSCLNLLSSDFFSATSAQLRAGSGGRGLGLASESAANGGLGACPQVI